MAHGSPYLIDEILRAVSAGTGVTITHEAEFNAWARYMDKILFDSCLIVAIPDGGAAESVVAALVNQESRRDTNRFFRGESHQYLRDPAQSQYPGCTIAIIPHSAVRDDLKIENPNPVIAVTPAPQRTPAVAENRFARALENAVRASSKVPFDPSITDGSPYRMEEIRRAFSGGTGLTITHEAQENSWAIILGQPTFHSRLIVRIPNGHQPSSVVIQLVKPEYQAQIESFLSSPVVRGERLTVATIPHDAVLDRFKILKPNGPIATASQDALQTGGSPRPLPEAEDTLQGTSGYTGPKTPGQD
jgi:hypothetical protein